MSSSSAQQDPLVGRTVGGSYTLQELIGVGGMGRVYLAEQTALGRTVAVKVIHPHLLGDEQTVARFYTEARASSRLNHPNSVSIIDFGRTDDGVL
ncbi:MAG: serine/threonine protein kinase, partial [Deltaproteobacteria bacterium]